MLQASKIQLLKNLREQERIQILTILMLSMENPRLVGYMVTGKLSIFLSANGSLAGLYHYPLMCSPPLVVNQCYEKKPYCLQKCIFLWIQLPDKLIRMPNFKIVLTGSRLSFISTWKMKTLGSLLHQLLNIGNDQQYLDQKMWLLYP